MKVLSILIVSFFLVACSSTSEINMYKQHIAEQDAIINKEMERLREAQAIIDKQNREVKYSSCKVFCF